MRRTARNYEEAVRRLRAEADAQAEIDAALESMLRDRRRRNRGEDFPRYRQRYVTVPPPPVYTARAEDAPSSPRY
jgi:hypothetical protein